MADKIDVPNVMTPKFRVSFPNVFRPGKPVDPTKAGKVRSKSAAPPVLDAATARRRLEFISRVTIMQFITCTAAVLR